MFIKNQILLDWITLMAFLTCYTNLEFDMASIYLSTADLFRENPPIIGKIQFTTAAKAPGWAKA